MFCRRYSLLATSLRPSTKFMRWMLEASRRQDWKLSSWSLDIELVDLLIFSFQVHVCREASELWGITWAWHQGVWGNRPRGLGVKFRIGLPLVFYSASDRVGRTLLAWAEMSPKGLHRKVNMNMFHESRWMIDPPSVEVRERFLEQRRVVQSLVADSPADRRFRKTWR